MSDLFGGMYSGDTSEETIPEINYDRPADGVYPATLTDIYPREGTTAKPDGKWINLEWTLDDTGETVLEWFTMPQDSAHPSDDERKKLGYYINRLGDLGVQREKVGSTNRESLVNLTAAITLRTKNGYQNVNRVDLTGQNVSGNFSNTPQQTSTGSARQAPTAPRRANPFPNR